MKKAPIILTSLIANCFIFAYGSNSSSGQLSPELQAQVNAIPKHTIKAHSRTPEENRRHQKICAKTGAVDVTDEHDIVVGDGTGDSIICISPIQQESSLNNESNVKSLSSIGEIPENSLNPLHTLAISYTDIFPPSGSVPAGPYYSYPYANFVNAVPNQLIAADTAVPADNCYTSGSDITHTSSGFIKIYLSCSRVLGRGATQSYFHVCSQGICGIGYGTVVRN